MNRTLVAQELVKLAKELVSSAADVEYKKDAGQNDLWEMRGPSDIKDFWSVYWRGKVYEGNVIVVEKRILDIIKRRVKSDGYSVSKAQTDS